MPLHGNRNYEERQNGMPYEVTASKKRPQNFDSVVGQDFVVSTLKSSLELERIAHAYLFSGPRGVGKTSAARILAKALNCEKGPTADPCGTCSLCTEIARGNSLDVIEIDGASNTSVNDVRELKDEVLFAPNSGRYKIYIIDEVHMLSNSAFNALLKTIEEPPPYIVFIFATTEVHKVPATIRSRCQQFNFRLIPVEIIKEKLLQTAEELGLSAEDEALFWIAKEATGSLRDAYTLFDQIASFSQNGITLAEIQEKLGLVGIEAVNDIVESMAKQDSGAVIEKAEEIFAQGVAIEQFVIDLTEYFRNILFLIHGVDRESLLGYPPSRFSRTVRDTFSSDQIEYALDRLFELFRNLRFSLNQRFETELVLSDLTHLSKRISPSALVDRIDGLKHELLSGKLGYSSGGESPATGGQEESDTHQGSNIPSERTEPETAEEPTDGPKDPSSKDPGPRDPGHRDPSSKDPGPRDLSPEEIKQLVEGLKSKPSLASAVQRAEKWRLDGESLMITCDSSYSTNKIREELSTLNSLITGTVGKKLDIHVLTSGENEEEMKDQDVDEQADLVKKVFRGQIVENGADNESDGPI
ncbi:MAG: DNA polymerase III subunit gamma/tau [Spirochaetia bacterium]